MVHAELYLQAGDVESVVAHVKQVQTNKKHPQDGMAEIMGMATASLGRFWEGDDLMNAFYGRCLRNEKVVEQVISTAKKLVAAGVTPANPANYNDLDDDLWAFIEEGVKKSNLPDVKRVDGKWKSTGTKEVSFPHTKYTIYHDSHGHCYLFFVIEHYWMHEGVRTVYNTELHVRYVYLEGENSHLFKKTPVADLWKTYYTYGDLRDKAWVLSASFRDRENDGKQQTECEASQRAKMVFYECQHFAAMEDDEEIVGKPA